MTVGDMPFDDAFLLGGERARVFAARLAHNARYDPIAAVRLNNLFALVRSFRDEPVTVEALRAARADPDSEVRLLAARALGDDGVGTLRELAAGPYPENIAASAIAGLGGNLDEGEAIALLDAALQQQRPVVARACAQALARMGSTAGESALLQVLGGAHEGLRVVAAVALGSIGTRRAVLPLQEAAERAGGDLRRAARHAAAKIQSRLSGAEKGQLTVSAGDSGQLALAPDHGGEVTMDPEREE